MRTFRLPVLPVLFACGAGDPATDVKLGETTAVLVMNPAVNEATDVEVAAPGGARSSVSVAPDEGPAVRTDSEGLVVLAPLDAGARTITVSTEGAEGTASLPIEEKDLREVAVAAAGTRVETMSVVVFPFGGEVVEVTPEMTVLEVNAALSRSNAIVVFRGGEYEGDLSFAGSNVALFGEGALGGRVTIRGNVTIPGSGNRLRGATITGALSVPGSDASISFTRVLGDLDVPGSGTILLANELCGRVEVTGSGILALGNEGLAPVDRPSCP